MNKELRIRFRRLKDRCYNKNSKSYKDYGGRGIYICDEWLSNPEAFEEWALNNGFADGLAIDRIDNDGPYAPYNCRFVTAKENNQNRRSTKWYVINGVKKNLQQWCDYYGINRGTVYTRLKNGWSIEKALTEPIKTYEPDKTSLIGKRFSRLVVVSCAGDEYFEQRKGSYWRCQCDCGNITIVSSHKLKSGHTKSCGCLNRDVAKHRMETNNPMKTEEQRRRMREHNPMYRR